MCVWEGRGWGGVGGVAKQEDGEMGKMNEKKKCTTGRMNVNSMKGLY